MYEWLPLINLHVPGAGVTAFNVWDLGFDWWRIYRNVVRQIIEQQKAAARK